MGLRGFDLPVKVFLFTRTMPPARQPSTEIDLKIDPKSVPDAIDYPPEFTALDRLIVSTIENSANKIRGALNQSEGAEMTRELVQLNASRKHSFFHSGFYDSAFEIQPSIAEPPKDLENRRWYLAGRLLGLMRLASDKCEDWVRAHPVEAQTLCDDKNPGRVRMLLPAFYSVLMNASLGRQASDLIKKGLPHLASSKRLEMQQLVLEDASDLLRNGDAAGSLLLANSLGDPDLTTDGLDASLVSFNRRLARKRAQSLQMLGQIKEAESSLQTLANIGDTEESIDALADLGLIAGGFPILYAIVPGKTPEEHQSLANALERGRTSFEEAVKRAAGTDETRARNAHLALGVMYTLKHPSDTTLAIRHLNLALAGMLKEPLSFEQGHLIAWARFLLGISTLETCDPARLRAGARLIQEALQSKVTFPLSLWSRCLAASAVFDDKSLTIEIAQELLRLRGPEIFDLIRSSGALERSRELRTLYSEMIDPDRRPVTALADDWEFILGEALKDGQHDLAFTVLDKLEGLAHSWDGYSDRFLGLLEDAERYSPAWQPSDADGSRIRILEAKGKFAEVSLLLQNLFWKRLSDKSYEAQAELGGIVEHLREIQRPAEEIALLESHLPSSEAAEEQEADEIGRELANGAVVRILFVGGDERQAQHDQTVTDNLADDYSGITVQFEHPGWGSNWKPICDRIQAHLRDYDGIVLSPLVRTNMGRCIRNMCDEETPWFPCPAKGPEFITRTIIQAAKRILAMRKAAPKI